MRISDISIWHLIIAVIVSLLLIILSLFAIERLTLPESPDIDPPVISIETPYPNAKAHVVENSINKVIEKSLKGMNGIRFIDSKSIDGLSTINIEFRLSRDIDEAENDTRKRVFSVLEELPEGADPPDVFKVDTNSDVILWLTLGSKQWNVLQLIDYVDHYLIDRLTGIEGVYRVRIASERQNDMQIWLNRQAMANKHVNVKDVITALEQNNIGLQSGLKEEYEQELHVKPSRQFRSVDDFENLVILKEQNGNSLHLNEIATIKKAAISSYSMTPGPKENLVAIGIINQSKTKALDVIKNIRKVIHIINLPPDIRLIDKYDASISLQQTMNQGVKTLITSIIFVLLAVLFCLLLIAYAN